MHVRNQRAPRAKAKLLSKDEARWILQSCPEFLR
jgi:hypothetical protein